MENENELPDGVVDVTSMSDKQQMVMTESGERVPLVEYEQRLAASWLDSEPDVIADMLERRGKNRARLLAWVRANLKDGTDFGVVKNRPSLWKAGAEKIAGMLGLQVHWPDLHSELDRLRNGATIIVLSCELLRDGQLQAQGAGARSIEQDGGDVNKAIKMCKKSAMIDAVLNAAGLSEVFTQDIDDDTNIDKAFISETSQQILRDTAERFFGDAWLDVLQSLARRRFHIDNGDWSRIPSFRLNDAIRSLEEKHEETTTETSVISTTDDSGS